MLPRHHALRHGATQPGDVLCTDPPEISYLGDRNSSQRVSSDDRVGVGGAGADIINLKVRIVVQNGLR